MAKPAWQNDRSILKPCTGDSRKSLRIERQTFQEQERQPIPHLRKFGSNIMDAAASAEDRVGVGRIYLGFCLSCLCGSVALCTRFFDYTDSAVGLLGLIILPFLFAFILTHGWVTSIGLVWINEIFFGVDGRWIEIGALQGRGALLIAFLAVSYFSQLSTRNRFFQTSHVGIAVLFYGMIVPCWLIFYSVIARETPMAAAFGDGTRYFLLLAYFPLRKLVQKDVELVFGWVCGGCVMLSLMMLFSAVGPQPFATIVYLAYSGADVIATLSSGISRTATPILVLTMIGVFLGVLYAVDNSQTKSARFIGLVLMSISLSPIVISFMRGPLFSMLGVSLLLLTAYTLGSGSKKIAWHLGLSIIGIGILSFVMMSIFVPEGLERLSLGEQTLYEYVADTDREEQAIWMLDAFAESPVLGKGIGVPISGYQRGGGSDVLSFELQYHMLLYRVGGVVFLLFIIPIIWFFLEPFRMFRNRRAFLLQRKGKLAMAVLLALLATFIAGATNPYLVTAFTMFLIALYLAIKQDRTFIKT